MVENDRNSYKKGTLENKTTTFRNVEFLVAKTFENWNFWRQRYKNSYSGLSNNSTPAIIFFQKKNHLNMMMK